MRHLCLLWMTLAMLGCTANKNGHDKNGDDTLSYTSSKPVNTGLFTTDTQDKGGDGQWWCFELSGSLRSMDGREACNRTKPRCEEMRSAAQSMFNYSATACAPRQRAICFPYVVATTGKEGERCFITGTECERVFREIMGNTETTGCAEQSNDRPPSGGEM